MIGPKTPFHERAVEAACTLEPTPRPVPTHAPKSARIHCPVCSGHDFTDFNGRVGARCAGCYAMERTRLMFAVMERSGTLRRDLDILHFAPEPGLGARLKQLAKRYVPADLDVRRYVKQFPEAECVDLCKDDLARFRGQFDLVIHSHVLEHLPCSIAGVLMNLAACLHPGGRMFFAVPIRKNARTEEEGPTEDLSGDERSRRYGQFDHVRMIGDQDAMQIFRRALGDKVSQFPVKKFFSDQEILNMAVPIDIDGLSGNSTFVFQA